MYARRARLHVSTFLVRTARNLADSESGLLIKEISETIKNEAKEQKGGFLPMLLGTLAASMLGSALTRKGVIEAGEETIRAGENF